MNSFGTIFRLTSFGESHGPAIGGIIDGMPSGIHIDIDRVQKELDRRRPGQSSITTARNETDRIEILSGMFEGVTTGTPIGFIVRNADSHSKDYDNLRHCYRPSHADYTYVAKYGLRDHRGGGRSSARETIARVVAGAFAAQALETVGIEIYAYTSKVGHINLRKNYREIIKEEIDNNPVRCPDPETADEMKRLIELAKSAGDTIGGTVTGVIRGCPAGLGSPVFDKLHAKLGEAMLSINAVKGFEYGLGFNGAGKLGSEVADKFIIHTDGSIGTLTNHSGGIQGGISNGEDIYFNVAFKPVATLLRTLETINDKGDTIQVQARGRHDPCVLPRAVPIVEAMARMVILDAWLLNKTVKM